MRWEDDKTILSRQEDGPWVAEVPPIPICYALMPNREKALSELTTVFLMMVEEYSQKGISLPADTTEIFHA